MALNRAKLRACLLVSALLVATPASLGVVVNGTGLITASGSDLGAYLGAGAFYSAGYTGTRATVVNVEGGQPWLGHQSLTTAGLMPLFGGAVASTQNHATGVTSIIGGRGSRPLDIGIAFGSSIYGGTLSSVQQGSQFGFTPATFGATYQAAMSGFVPAVGGNGSTVAADVINSSWASASPWVGQTSYTDAMDALVDRYHTAVVVAAGNSGDGQNTVTAPAAAFNVIAVGALHSSLPSETTPRYDTVSSFSSRSPTTVNFDSGAFGTRAAISLSAPGEDFSVAGYNGEGTVPNWYYFKSQGTSYAAPTVAGAVALLDDVGYARFGAGGMGANRAAVDGRTIRAVLMNSAVKIPGWNNGANIGSGGVYVTTQAVDYNSGAGALDIGRALTQYTGGGLSAVGATTGNVSITGGVGRAVSPVGWNFDSVSSGERSDRYDLGALLGGSMFTATLDWFAEGTYTDATYAGTVDSLANLSLELYRVLPSGGMSLVGWSNTTLNNVEHVYFALPATGAYELRVNYLGEDYGIEPGATSYAVAWWGSAVPEPGVGGCGLVGAAGGLLARRRGR